MNHFDWDEPLPESRRNELTEQIAQRIHKFGLESAAILALEMHKPLAYLAGQSILMGSGFLALLMGPRRTQQISKYCQDSANIEHLIRRLEDLSEADAAPKTADRPRATRKA